MTIKLKVLSVRTQHGIVNMPDQMKGMTIISQGGTYKVALNKALDFYKDQLGIDTKDRITTVILDYRIDEVVL